VAANDAGSRAEDCSEAVPLLAWVPRPASPKRAKSLKSFKSVEVIRGHSTVVGGYSTQPEPLGVMSRAANAAKAWRLRTCGRLYLYDTLLERLAYNLKHMAFEFGPLVSAQKPIMGQGRESRGRAAVANGVSLKFSGGHLRRVSYTYNFAGVLNFNVFATLAARLTNLGGPGRGR
jgi:hypothetical protein